MRRSGPTALISSAELHEVTSLSFGVLSPQEIESMSVSEVSSSNMTDEWGRPTEAGINDLRLGPGDSELTCETCMGKKQDCPGHFGHIRLSRPVYHPGFLSEVKCILQCVCLNCSKLLISPQHSPRLKRACAIKDKKARSRQVWSILKTVNKCATIQGKDNLAVDTAASGCGAIHPKIIRSGYRLYLEYETSPSEISDRKRPLPAFEALAVLQRISDQDCLILGYDSVTNRPDWMIIQVLPVAPPAIRPSVVVGSGLRAEDDLTSQYAQIVKANDRVKADVQRGAPSHLTLQDTEILQVHVSALFDNQVAGVPVVRQRSGKAIKSISERLKGKEGRMRGNLMGKRVDFSGRSVITPDPNLALDELGVPLSIAVNLTIPETVTAYNCEHLKTLILRGPAAHPGAKYIIRPDGSTIDLRFVRKRSELHIEPGFRVERHLKNGDFVIFNRQPSLHKMSMMAHRVKVMHQSSFRLNLSVVSPYNADFDGDEMNMHVPQSFDAKAELTNLMHVPSQIVSPQANCPVIGMVQDALLGVSRLTLKDTFLEVWEMMDLLTWIDHFSGELPQPAILLPRPLWTGKQLFSLLLPSVNLQQTSNTHDPEATPASISDTKVLISKGKLLTGIVDKRTVGASSGSLIHVIWMEHGPQVCADFLTFTQRVVNHWLENHSFSVGISDCIADKATTDQIKSTLREAKSNICELIRQAENKEIQCQPGKTMLESFEFKVNSVLNDARDQAGKSAMRSISDRNSIKAMANAGSKGSAINICQIMACVGQQNIEGKRIAFAFDKRTLPHFSKQDYGPESRGFVENSYISGLNPQEFFFHAMGGREGISDKAVKTAETGYLQRRLMKALEDVVVTYDGTVRSSQGNIVQFLYGEDGMSGEFIEDQYLETLKMDVEALSRNYQFLPEPFIPSQDMLQYRSVLSESVYSQIATNPEMQAALHREYADIRHDQTILRAMFPTFNEKQHLPVPINRLICSAKQNFSIKLCGLSDIDPLFVITHYRKLIARLEVVPGADTISMESQCNATRLFAIHLRSQLATKRIIVRDRLSKDAFLWLIGEIEHRFVKAKVHPGEAVGSLAAQSIGEPATQMTLNTFHFAGVSSKNVTLGIPRLKEIINVSKTLKAPTLAVYLTEEYSQSPEAAKEVVSKLEYYSLRDILVVVQIIYDPGLTTTLVIDDLELVNDYFAIPDEHIDLHKLSLWVLRLQFDKLVIMDKKISMLEITEKIAKEYPGDLHLIASDDNADSLVLRIRVMNDEETDHQGDTFSLLKALKTDLLQLHLRGVEGVTKVYMQEIPRFQATPTGAITKSREWKIETDGCNLAAAIRLRGIDHTRTVSNDVSEVASVLGIEAARLTILTELRKVLSVYGIYVNYRHLSVLCDVMTTRGYPMSITRSGVCTSAISPLQKASFEQTVSMLISAGMFGQEDELTGVSARVVVGKVAAVGTGVVELMIDAEKLQSALRRREVMEDQSNLQESWAVCGTPIVYSPSLRGDATPGRDAFDAQRMHTPGCQFSPGPVLPTSPSYISNSPFHSSFSPFDRDYPLAPLCLPSPNYMKHHNSTFLTHSVGSSPYSPTSPWTSSASIEYSPTSTVYYPVYSSVYSPTSPVYSPTSPVYPSASPAYPSASPAYSVYSPTSPVYSPTSSAYSPASSAYFAQSTPISNPSSPFCSSAHSPYYSPQPLHRPSSPLSSDDEV